MPWLQPGGGRSLGILILLLVFAAGGQTPNLEYRVKSAYLFNFAKFVSWPASAFASADAPIVIGILGKDPFGSELDQTVAGKTIEKRPLQVMRLSDADPLGACHILFIASSEGRQLGWVFERLGQSPVLTVGEMEEFTELGGMIRFVPYEKNIRFEIDLQPVEAAGLKMSSKLLQVATSVKGKARP